MERESFKINERRSVVWSSMKKGQRKSALSFDVMRTELANHSRYVEVPQMIDIGPFTNTFGSASDRGRAAERCMVIVKRPEVCRKRSTAPV